MAIPSAILPEFAAPPVVEVALDLQFEALPMLRGPQLGLFWSAIRDRFPNAEEQIALAPLPEDALGTEMMSTPRIQLSVLDAPPVARIWLTSEDASELMQVQQDRFIMNWRKVEGGTAYPHYNHVKALFQEQFERFRSFVDREKLGKLVPKQCAVTYYNHIVAEEGSARHGQLHRVLATWKAPLESSPLPEPEDVRLSARYHLSNDAGGLDGWLYVDLQPAFRRSDSAPIYVLTLTARDRPEGEELEDVLRVFDHIHQWAARAFVTLTTPEMQEKWGAKI